MKKRNPSSGQNGQLVHWWLLIHSGHGTKPMHPSFGKSFPKGPRTRSETPGSVDLISTNKTKQTNYLPSWIDLFWGESSMFQLLFLGDGPMQQSDSFKQQQIQKKKKTFRCISFLITIFSFSY